MYKQLPLIKNILDQILPYEQAFVQSYITVSNGAPRKPGTIIFAASQKNVTYIQDAVKWKYQVFSL